MAVRVTVRSNLPEFAALRLEDVEVEDPGETTWEYFLHLHRVKGFNSAHHVITTSRGHRAFGNDFIQATTSLFRKRPMTFHVHIRRNVGIRAGVGQISLSLPAVVASASPGRRNRSRESARRVSTSTTDSDATMPIGIGIRIRGSSILSEALTGSSESKSSVQRAASQARQSNLPPVVDISSMLQPSRNNSPLVDPPNLGSHGLDDDAMSQDSQDAEEEISSTKARFLTVASRYSNADFAQFGEELRILHASLDRSRRWEDKTPRLANFLNKTLLYGSRNTNQ